MINLRSIKTKLYNRLALILFTGLLGGCDENIKEYSEIKHKEAIVTSHRDSWIQLVDQNFITHPDMYIMTSINKGIEFRVEDIKFLNRFRLNDSVEVGYREVYNSRYKNIDKDGKKELIERRLIGYEFLNAQPK